jgi:hypothetical protein
MALESANSETKTTPMEKVFLRKLLPEEISPAALGNPVDAIIAFREDMARFRKVGISKEALREAVRKELNAACMEGLQQSATDAGADRRPVDRPGYLNIEPFVEYLTERWAIRPKLPRARIRRLAKSVLKESSEGSQAKRRFHHE